jgi:CPA2 family monovalent cation:H+ antiporter-2
MSVRAIAVPGALLQMALATLLGIGLGMALGWPLGGSLIFGTALSIASTVVVLRALQERRLLETERGRIAVGWLIVEDIVMVFVLVLLPPFAGVFKGASPDWMVLAELLAITFAKVAAFVALMLLVGKRFIPWILHYVAHTGSRELFRLAVLAIALGVAYAASTFFGVSFALGAFFAGMIMSESALSQRAASESLPLRDAFAVLFFASVGMLFDPTIVAKQPLAVIATLLIIVVAKAALGYGIVRMFGQPRSSALMIGVSRAQIGEFSFILAGLGVALALLPEEGRDLILAGAILSLLINPLYFTALDNIAARKQAASAAAEAEKKEKADAAPAREPIPPTTLTDHVVLVGFGRVGSVIGDALIAAKTPLLVIEDNTSHVERLRRLGVEELVGNAADPDVIGAANIPAARCLLVAIPDGFEGGQIVEQARRLNETLPIIARAHSKEEMDHLNRHGATTVIMGENLIADAMIEQVRDAVKAATG